jgi:hypothetical protein
LSQQVRRPRAQSQFSVDEPSFSQPQSVSGDTSTIKISWADVVACRAYVRIGPEAKIKLAHMAGAPWFHKDPTAKLHERQIEAIQRPEREKIIHGGSRWGKSVAGGVEGLCEAMLPGSNLAVVAARYDHVAYEWQYIYRGLKTLFADHGQALLRLKFVHRPSQHDYDFETIWGSNGRGFSVDSDEGAALLGQAFSRMIFGEGSHISQEILEKKAMRALDGALMERQEGRASDETGYLTIYTTPKEFEGCSAAEWDRVMKQTKSEPRKLWYGAVSFEKSVWMREADVTENPVYSKAVYEARKSTLSKAAFDEQYRGKMTFKTGRVITEFNEDQHVFEGQPDPALVRKMTLGVGIDTGAQFGGLLGGLVRVGDTLRRYKLGEVYLAQTDIYTCLNAMQEMIVNTLGPVFDTEDPALLFAAIPVFAVDPASQHKPEIHSHWGKFDVSLTSPPGLHGGKLELAPSLDVLRSWVASNAWWVSDDCQILIDQLRRYVWKQVKAAGMKNAPVIKEPRKSYDHLIDAARFLDFCLEAEGPREDPVPRMTLAAAMEKAQRDRIFGPLRAVLDDAAGWEETHGISWEE